MCMTQKLKFIFYRAQIGYNHVTSWLIVLNGKVVGAMAKLTENVCPIKTESSYSITNVNVIIHSGNYKKS